MINNFVKRMTSTYRFAIVFICTAFMAAMIPVLVEAFQHIVEVKFGMFVPDDGLNAHEKIIRLIVGVFKVLSIISISLILPRYFIHKQQINRAFGLSTHAWRALLIFVSFIIIFLVIALFGSPWAIDFLEARGIVFPAKLKPFMPMIILVVLTMPLQYKATGSIATLFDDTAMSKIEIARLNKLMSSSATLCLLLAVVPLMVLHYYLGSVAMGKTGLMLFTTLAFDSLVVGALAALAAATLYVIYIEARQQA